MEGLMSETQAQALDPARQQRWDNPNKQSTGYIRDLRIPNGTGQCGTRPAVKAPGPNPAGPFIADDLRNALETSVTYGDMADKLNRVLAAKTPPPNKRIGLSSRNSSGSILRARSSLMEIFEEDSSLSNCINFLSIDEL
jgi:hypothetical protein